LDGRGDWGKGSGTLVGGIGSWETNSMSGLSLSKEEENRFSRPLGSSAWVKASFRREGGEEKGRQGELGEYAQACGLHKGEKKGERRLICAAAVFGVENDRWGTGVLVILGKDCLLGGSKVGC